MPHLNPFNNGAMLATVSGLVLSVTLFTSPAFAIQIELASSMNQVGSGARATGMGGAFIAVADDATAASWNPAGLIHLEKPEMSLVHGYSSRTQTYNSSNHPELQGNENSIDVSDINYASAAYPFQLFNRNMVVSLNYQRLYELNKKYAINGYVLNGQGAGDSLKVNSNFTQTGYLGAFSPAIAIQVTPELYFGATVNIWDDFAGTSSWKSSYRDSSTGTIGGVALPPTSWAAKYTFSGLNANLGLLYSLNSRYNFGFVYKTPFSADVDYSSTYNGTASREKFQLTMPASYGLGFSYRHSDSLSVAMDIYRTEWSDFILTDYIGNKIHPFTGASIKYGGKLKDTTQIRIGGEYLIIGDRITVPVRVGFYYDPEPGIRLAGADTAGNNIYKSATDDFYGLSFGSGVAMGSYAFDFSYQYRWGNCTTGDIPYTGTTSTIVQHIFMTSLIYHF